ncbi:DUF4440 domain-containing protein [Rossellomorea vietnamensis]|uniref:DUF4440 domain-containing protein n=1 Tax=Rossellomorea vietnamensis TaxID=218284 RepID=UPI0037C8A661
MINEDIKKKLHQLESNLLKPEIRSSKTELTRILAEGFFEIGSSGKFLYQNEEISEEGIGEVKMTMDHFEVHPLSDEIVLTTYS